MDAEEIRNQFGHNSVYAVGRTGYEGQDNIDLARVQILAIGELAAQIADLKVQRRRWCQVDTACAVMTVVLLGIIVVLITGQP